MNSMTGFGRAELCKKEYKISIELSSVNSRYLECVFRMPRNLAGLESMIKEAVSQKLARGKLTITVNLEETPSDVELIDMKAAEAYFRQLKRLKKKLKIGGDIEIGHIIASPELLLGTKSAPDESTMKPDLSKVVTKALRDLVKMRAAEGRNLQRDMKQRCVTLSRLVTLIEKQSPKNVTEYRKRLEKRIKDLGDGLILDDARLAEEVTVYADRSDVTEECIRLRSHIDLFTKTLNKSGVAGKRLNFILQEMGREANTIGSKSLSSTTSENAIALKEEIEKLREQVQNIE